MICNLLPNKSSDSPVQQDLRQELLDFASKWPELKKILPEHCIELDEAGNHFFILLLINYLQVNVLNFYDTARAYNYLMPIFHTDGNVII